MPKPYDDAMKKLVGLSPQDFLSLVLEDAIFTRELPGELRVENIHADGLIEGTLDGEWCWYIWNFRVLTTLASAHGY